MQLAQTDPVTSNPTAHVHNLLSSAKPRKAEKLVIVGFSNKPVLLLKHESEKAKYSHKHTHTHRDRDPIKKEKGLAKSKKDENGGNLYPSSTV